MNGSVTPVSGMTRVTPPTITNTWSANIARQAGGEQRREGVLREHGGLEPARDEQQVGEQHGGRAEQAELGRDHGVDHVRLRRGQQADRRPGIVSTAWPNPWPNSPPAAWAKIALASW